MNRFTKYLINLNQLFILLFLTQLRGQDRTEILYSALPLNDVRLYKYGISITTPCGNGFRETTLDLSGRKVSEIETSDGRRCGITKIYNNGVLIKEINYLNDYVISYKSYKNGVLFTEINADRKRVVVNGALLPITWNKLYIKFSRYRFVTMTRKNFIDNLLRFEVPENVASMMKDLESKIGSGVGGGKSGVLACSESFSRVDDSRINLQSSTSSGKKDAQGFINNLGSTCSAITRDKINDDFNGKSGNAAEQARVEEAKSRIDNMISACRDRANSPGMFENPIGVGVAIRIGVGALIDAGIATTEGAAIVTTEAAVVTSSAAGATIIEGVAVEATATAITETAASTVLSQSARTVAATTMEQSIRSLPGLVEAATTELASIESAKTMSLAITRFVASAGALVAAIGGTTANAAGTPEPPMEVCEVEENDDNDSNGQTMADANQGQSPVPQNPSGGSTTPDEAAVDNCARLVWFRDYCNNNGWQTMECQDAAGILTGCGKTDPRVIYVSPMGEPTGSGCYDVSKAQAVALECKKRSMFARLINGSSACLSKGPFDLRSIIRDPGNIDPSPIDGKLYHNSFSKIFSGSKIKLFENISLKNLKSNFSKLNNKSLVVFVDSDCSACKAYSKTLLSKEVGDAMSKGVDVIVVDVAGDPAIVSEYGILGFPTIFLRSSKGEFSLPILGNLTSAETNTVMLSK